MFVTLSEPFAIFFMQLWGKDRRIIGRSRYSPCLKSSDGL
jgi:hypothetical protein